MSKSDQQVAKNQANQQIAQNTSNEGAADSTARSILGTAQSTATNLLPSAVSGYSDIASTGGYDPSILGSINKSFSDLSTTGGVSPAQETAIRNRAGEAARSTYDVGAATAERKAAATGGYGVSGSVAGELAREGGLAASRAVSDADASIVGMEQQGKIAGTAGLASTQQNQTQNKLQATAGITNIYGMNEQQISQTVDQILRNYQQTGTLNNQDLSILTNLANQPGVFDKIVSTIGTLGGAAAGIMGASTP